VPIDLENAPKLERKPDAPKEKKKKDAVTPATADSSAAPAKKSKEEKVLKDGTSEADAGVPTEPAPAPEGKKKKEKEPKAKGDAAAVVAEGGKKKGGAAPPVAKAPAEDAGEPVPSMIDLRVGHIVDSGSEAWGSRAELMLRQSTSTRMRTASTWR
jgi:aminoacyl tRNA synthase complex-interacting multifunctional protein 1